MRTLIAAALLLACALPAAARDKKDTCIGSCWQCMHGCTEKERISYCCPKKEQRPVSAPEAPAPAFCRWWAMEAPRCAA